MELFPYQKEGVDFICYKPRAILGDDMGLGKTLQLITAAMKQTDATRILVVCPNSLKYFWANELKKWYNISSTVVNGTPQLRSTQIAYKSKWTIINYESLRLHKEELQIRWDIVIFDESHRLKNRKALMFKAAKYLTKKAQIIWCSSGTPILNRLSELWTTLHIMYPKKYGSYWKFCENYCEVFNNGWGMQVRDILDPDHRAIQEIREVLKPMMIRRLKSEVLKDLPEKIISQVWVDLVGKQRNYYDEMEKDFCTLISSKEYVEAPVKIAQIIRLKQIAISAQLIDAELDNATAKIDALLEILEDSPKPVVVFSAWKKTLNLVVERLPKDLVVKMITGEVPVSEREQIVLDFQAGKIDVLLATIGAGGVGITLTRASVVIFLDKDWTPALNRQAQDRLHRIGQKESVLVYELLARNTIEEDIEKLLAKKIKLCENVLDYTPVLDLEFDFDDIYNGMVGRNGY